MNNIVVFSAQRINLTQISDQLNFDTIMKVEIAIVADCRNYIREALDRMRLSAITIG